MEAGARLRAGQGRRQGARRHPYPHLLRAGAVRRRFLHPGPGRRQVRPVLRRRQGRGGRRAALRLARRSGRQPGPPAGHRPDPLRPLSGPPRNLGHGRDPPGAGRRPAGPDAGPAGEGDRLGPARISAGRADAGRQGAAAGPGPAGGQLRGRGAAGLSAGLHGGPPDRFRRQGRDRPVGRRARSGRGDQKRRGARARGPGDGRPRAGGPRR